MSVLTSKARNRLKASQFAGPDRSYPTPDASHAANAKARATQAVNAGRLSPAQAAAIKAKANKVLSKHGGKKRKKTAESAVVAAMRRG